MIELIQISKTYNSGKPNSFTAIHKISQQIPSKRITVLKGPSGSGKTTLLSIIGCLTRPTTGRIRVMGREITSLPERFAAGIRRETFGFIFQNYNLVRGISVLENVMLPAFPNGPSHQRLKTKALALLQKLHIDNKADQKIEHLSGGEQQRTAIARALINDPTYLIADEPTAHLDSQRTAGFMEIIKQLKTDKKTIIIASHDPLVFSDAIVDKVITLHDGQIVANEEDG